MILSTFFSESLKFKPRSSKYYSQFWYSNFSIYLASARSDPNSLSLSEVSSFFKSAESDLQPFNLKVSSSATVLKRFTVPVVLV